jgi:cysteine desulfurase
MPAKSAIYLDSSAGLPLLPEVKQALLERLTRVGEDFPFNPASPHSFGQQAKRVLETARRQVLASLLSEKACQQAQWLSASSLVFTGSGTEANQWVIRSVLERSLEAKQPTHWITSVAEHDSVLQMVPWARSRGVHVTLLPVDAQGQPDYEIYLSALKQNPTLVSLLYINNETGVILQSPHQFEGETASQDAPSTALQAWVEPAHQARAQFHIDAAQAWGKVPLELDQMRVDYATFSAHKIGAFAGSGAIWISPECAPGAQFSTGALILGKAEGGRRGGTPSTLAALAMGVAAASHVKKQRVHLALLTQVRDQFESLLQQTLGGRVRVNGADSKRVGVTSNISFLGVDGQGLIAALDLEGYAVSSGAACSSGTLAPSHVLLAMGVSEQEARASIRVSFSEGTLQLQNDHADWMNQFVNTLLQVTQRMPLRGRMEAKHERNQHV